MTNIEEAKTDKLVDVLNADIDNGLMNVMVGMSELLLFMESSCVVFVFET